MAIALSKHTFADVWMGGVKSAISGGEWSPIRDMIGGALSSVGNGFINENVDGLGLKMASSAVLGGTISEIGGGKFSNGAITGAYSMLFNDLVHGIAQKRRDLANSARREYLNNSTKWATKNGQPQCNIFAQDMMKENDMAPAKYLSAGDWGNEKKNIDGWQIITDGSFQAGDVVAYQAQYSNATGHMGIMVNSKVLVYAGSSINPMQIEASHIKGWKADWVVRRYIGQ